ncbi:MAG TPA: hypothetical protein VM689_04320 [Aliidongia sp.]|nr:hypothetical protein [Aliidongia sp.]
MKYDPEDAEKYKTLMRAAKPDAMQISFALGRQGKDPVLFTARGKPNTAIKGMVKANKGAKLTNMGQLVYHDNQIVLNCRKAPSIKIRTDFLEFFKRSGISPLTRNIVLKAPGEWHDDVSGEEVMDVHVEADTSAEEDAPVEEESGTTETEEPSVGAQPEAPEVDLGARLAALSARQVQLADFLKGAAAEIRNHADLIPVFKDALQKTTEAKGLIAKQDADGADAVLTAAEADREKLASLGQAPAPSAEPEQPVPAAPAPEQPSTMAAYIQRQVDELIGHAKAQVAFLGEQEKQPDYSVFARVLNRHLNGSTEAVDNDVVKLQLAIGRPEMLAQLLGLGGGKSYKAPSAKGWSDARKAALDKAAALKNAIKQEFAAEAGKIDEGFGQLDAFFTQIDDKLADEIEQLAKITDKDKKAEQEKKAEKLLEKYRSELASRNAFLSEIDKNPWGVQTDLVPSLTKALEAVGKSLAPAA